MKGPVYVDWAITKACNLNCRHCVGMEAGELSHDDALRVTKDIIELAPRWVILEGGEPLLRRDLPGIGKMLHEKGIDVFVITNGNAFNEERLRSLASFSPKVLFSIDGADAAVYEDTKQGGSFETAKEWASRCAEAGIFHGITTVLSRLNLAQVEDLIRLTESLGGEKLIFLPLKPFGEERVAREYYERNGLSPREQEEAISRVYRCQSKLDIFYDEPFLWNVAAKNGFSVSREESGITIPEVKGCAAAYSLYIQTDGSVRPCMFCPDELNFGRAGEEPLGDIWVRMKQSELLMGWADRKARKGRCGQCPQFESCRGCLARTFRLLDDSLESDPCCPLAAREPAKP